MKPNILKLIPREAATGSIDMVRELLELLESDQVDGLILAYRKKPNEADREHYPDAVSITNRLWWGWDSTIYALGLATMMQRAISDFIEEHYFE